MIVTVFAVLFMFGFTLGWTLHRRSEDRDPSLSSLTDCLWVGLIYGMLCASGWFAITHYFLFRR